MAPLAVLIDGPLEGDQFPVKITDRRLPQLVLTVPVPVFDEDHETFDWAETRYMRLQLLAARTDPDQPWKYFWLDRPERP